MPSEPSILDRYFDCWRRHDVVLLRELFHDDATYYIRDKRTLTGIEEIVRYWERNRARHLRLTVFPHVETGELAPEGSCVFCASFADGEDGTTQLVYGILRLILRDGRIARLEEAYGRYVGPLLG